MQATGTATDPLGLSDTDVKILAEPSGSVGRTIRSSFFANRVNFGNSITDNVLGPEVTPDPYQHLVGPVTKGIKVQAIADHRSMGMRVMKMPAGHGVVTASCWNNTGTLLQSKAATWVADGGGWYEFLWDSPVDLAAEEFYHFGVHYSAADQNYAMNTYVWNNGQDTCVYPLLISGATPPAWSVDGSSPTFPTVGYTGTWHNYYVDPISEWDVEIAGYDAGVSYYEQFPNGGSRFPFPLVIDWADAPYLEAYKSLGMNTVIVGGGNEDYFGPVVDADMDFYPCLHGNDMSGPMAAVSGDAELAERIRGYFITDEPEYDKDRLPTTLRTWRNNARRIDSTRPMYINLGRNIIENQGFQWQPPGISARDVNQQYRDFLALVDQGSMDAYGIARTFPYTYSGNDSKRYGIWFYPLQIKRMRSEITDGSVPIWGEVETTSAYANEPTPLQVERAVWSMLIAGAKGILYFDHRFSSPAVSQNFNAMLSDAPMAAKITALNAQITTLADVLNADEIDIVSEYTSTGTLATNQGGYPAGASIPMHYSARVVEGTTFLVCQSIRDGGTTASFHIPGFEGATFTVFGESRTLDVDVDGWLTDDFDDGDYEYHIYFTTDTPVFTAPELTSDPVISTDGTPETGETVTCSSGTWTGAPTPTYSYEWLRSTDAGSTWDPISGATEAAYTLQVADEGAQLRCHVTASNSQGDAAANSDVIEPAAPGADAHTALVASYGAVAHWRLKDLTDSIGSHDLTAFGPATTLVDSLTSDATDNARQFDDSGDSYFETPDASDIRLGEEFSLEYWLKSNIPGAGLWHITKVGDFSIGQISNTIRFSPHGTSSWYTYVSTPADIVSGDVFQVVATWDRATKLVSIYLNGELAGTVDASTFGFSPTTSGWGVLRIGAPVSAPAGSGGTDGMATGVLDEIAIYPSVLDDTQIANLYAAGAP